MNDFVMLGARLRTKRQEKKLTLNDVSKKSGISLQTIMNIENGKMKYPWTQTLYKICNVLDIELDELLK